MREMLKRILNKLFFDSEKEFLRQQVKDLQTQVLVMANKQMEYVNAKIATTYTESSPVSVNPDTGQLETQVSEEEQQQRKAAKEELLQMFGGAN